MRLYLVRHGETQGNQERRYLGWEDLPLTPLGEAQAGALAARLAGEPLTGIWSSDLSRARTTAEAIAARHALPIQIAPSLRETNFGDWSGLTYDEIAQQAPAALWDWIGDPERHAPPGGERLGDLRQRVLTALPRQDGALVVTHGGVIQALLSAWLGCSLWEVHVPLASLTILEWDGARLLQAICVGDAAHLAEITP